MQKIKILSSEIYKKIAAGEVVERPASVVKELIENSIDAKSSEIDVNIENGGLTKIKVTDNGEGIEKDDIQNAFKHHATSKIINEDDLLKIQTMGFRGEALSSIASVSKFSLISKTENTNEANTYKIEGGEPKEAGVKAFNKGTSIEVKDLFFNVPARRKFLKSPSTEFMYIAKIFIELALANCSVSFKLVHNTKEIYDLKKAQNLKERIKQIFGEAIYNNLIPIMCDEPHIKIDGFVGKPQTAYLGRSKQYVFVNKRSVRDKVVSAAAREAFGNLIMHGANPLFFISIEVPWDFVDVNTHPRKEEVKFQNSNLIYSLVKSSISKALFKKDLSYTAKNFTPAKDRTSASYFSKRDVAATLKFYELQEEKPKKVLILRNLFLVTASEDALAIYDQHALHERILYEGLKSNIVSKNAPVQPLLVPQVINLSADDFEILKRNVQTLKDAGFDLEVFGDRKFKLNAVPTNIKMNNPQNVLMELVEDLQDKNVLRNIGSSAERVLSLMACRSAIKAGDRIAEEAALDLINKAKSLEENTTYTCPHGRPFKVLIGVKELEKMFKRVL